jgi:predicted nucleotide-binding protein
MAKINQDLIAKLSTKLDVRPARIYALIQKVSAEKHIARNLAALILASRNGLSWQKYATAEEMRELSGLGGGGSRIADVTAPAATPVMPAKAIPRKGNGAKKGAKPKENTVFVVHGRDTKLTQSMYDFLGALKLQPLEWAHALDAAKGANPDVGEAVEKVLEKAQAIVVLLSPDDEGKLQDQFVGADERNTEGKLQGQARLNVVFEAGLALGAHQDKTLIVQVGKVKKFTDLGGMHILHLGNDVASRQDFARRLGKLGCKPDTKGNHWHTAGNLEPAAKKPPKPARKRKRA